MSIVGRGVTDWSMDNLWAYALDHLKEVRPDLWDKLYVVVRQHSALSRGALIAMMQGAGWMKDALPFLSGSLKSLGDDALGQSAGAIVNYFRRQPELATTPAFPESEVRGRIEAMEPELSSYVRGFRIRDEGSSAPRDVTDLIRRLQTQYERREGTLTAEDARLLGAVSERMRTMPEGMLRYMEGFVADSEDAWSLFQRVLDGKENDAEAARVTGRWMERNIICRTYLTEMMQQSADAFYLALQRREAALWNGMLRR